MGNWKSLIEMEECLTLQELNALVEGAQKKEERHNRFMAAVQGIDLGEEEAPDDVPTFEEVKRRAEAIRRGLSETEVDRYEERKAFEDIGIDFA